jgi:hypothetical protein
MDSGEEVTEELFGPQVTLSMEDQASYAQILSPNIRPPIGQTPLMSFMDNLKVKVRQGRYRIAYYQVPTCLLCQLVTILFNYLCREVCICVS